LGLFVQNLDNTISNLQAAQEKRNRATSQEADHKQRVSKLQAHQLDLQTKASELKSIDQKVKSLEAELQLWKSKRTQKCLELQTVHAESQGLVRGVELISRAEQDIQTLQSEIADLEMLPLMSWAGLLLLSKSCDLLFLLFFCLLDILQFLAFCNILSGFFKPYYL
jgi:DNA repair ATPase RecN